MYMYTCIYVYIHLYILDSAKSVPQYCTCKHTYAHINTYMHMTHNLKIFPEASSNTHICTTYIFNALVSNGYTYTHACLLLTYTVSFQ